jgi:putative Mn2+ efflux pump MntP
MTYIEMMLIALGLSMDAFAASISKGLCLSQIKHKYAFIIALFFGGFQLIMPLIGWFLAKSFAVYITSIDHWIAFVLLSFIGVKMIYEAVKKKEIECCSTTVIDIKNIVILSIATSIDALAIGVTFAFLPNVDISIAVLIIGLITFGVSYLGVFIGHRFGMKLGKNSEIFGGIVLIFIGTKILIEHLGLFSF